MANLVAGANLFIAAVDKTNEAALEVASSIHNRMHTINIQRATKLSRKLIAQFAALITLQALDVFPSTINPLMIGLIVRLSGRITNAILTAVYSGLHAPNTSVF